MTPAAMIRITGFYAYFMLLPDKKPLSYNVSAGDVVMGRGRHAYRRRENREIHAVNSVRGGNPLHLYGAEGCRDKKNERVRSFCYRLLVSLRYVLNVILKF